MAAPLTGCAARAAPYEKGTETRENQAPSNAEGRAARAAPYEKGTETKPIDNAPIILIQPRARPPMRRGLKLAVEPARKWFAGLPRARPPMRRGLKRVRPTAIADLSPIGRARGPL